MNKHNVGFYYIFGCKTIGVNMTAVTGDMALAATQIQSAFSNLTWHITTTCEYGLNLQSWNKVSDSSHTVSHCAESSLQVFYCNVGQVKHKSWILKCYPRVGNTAV